MRVVRAAGGARLVPREAVDAVGRARALLAEAERERDRVLASAREEAEALRTQAYREGREQARAESSAWMTAATARWSAALEAEQSSVVTLACDVVLAVLGRESSLGVEVVRDVTKQALSRVRRARRVVLKVSPHEIDGVRAAMQAWLPAGMTPDVLDVESDPSVRAGGVIVETELGRLDARLDVQLAAIRRALAQE